MELEPLSISAVPGEMWDISVRSGQALLSFPAKMVGLTEAAFTDQARDPEGPVGVVGVSRISGEVAAADAPPSWRIAQFLAIVASLNLFLFLFNLLPVLPLDGGHVAGRAVRRGSSASGLFPGPARPRTGRRGTDVTRGIHRGFGARSDERDHSVGRHRRRSAWGRSRVRGVWVPTLRVRHEVTPAQPLELGTSVGVRYIGWSPAVRATPTPVPKSNACA